MHAQYGQLLNLMEIFYMYMVLRERSGSVVECLTRDRGFEPHWRNSVVVLEQDTFILA